jgi:hypothetical protein
MTGLAVIDLEATGFAYGGAEHRPLPGRPA